jgi:hypothetical protein
MNISLRPIVLIALLSIAQGAAAQEVNQANCPQLRTIEMTRQQIEVLRAQREAGIDRLPTAQHQRLALDSLYRWYWPRLARLEQQRAEMEAFCYRSMQMRQDDSVTRAAPLPQEPYPTQQPYEYRYPYPNDPFSGGYGRDPYYVPQTPYARYPAPRMYPPYRSRGRGGVYDPRAQPPGNYDPFSQR